MKDACLEAALRSIGKRPNWCPAREYAGDRPNLNWPAFLCQLHPFGHVAPPKLVRQPLGMRRYK
jgi:hypothetical protein